MDKGLEAKEVKARTRRKRTPTPTQPSPEPKEEKKRWLGAKKTKEPRKPREPRPTKEKLFSEAHPQAYHLAKAIMPRLHTFLISIGLLIAALLELTHRNYDFVMDWYRDSWIGPATLNAMLDFQTWFQTWGIIFLIIMAIIIMVLVVFYLAFWRMAFKNYNKRSEGSTTYEGRCYWRTNNSLTRMWDRMNNSPPRTKIQYYLHTGWLPLFNILNPPGCMIVLETDISEKMESKGIYNINVYEKPIRRLVNYNTWRTFDNVAYVTGPIPLDYSRGVFDERSKTLVDDTMQLSFGNAENRNSIMKDGLRLTSPKIRRHIIDGRKHQ